MEANTLGLILLSCIASFIAVHWAYFKILKIAKVKNLVDNPDARKLQKTPVPVLGGITVFFGVAIGIGTGVVCNSLTDSNPLSPMYSIICAMIIMLYVGAMDDILGLSPKTRFLIEILTVLALIGASGGCIDSLHGLWNVGGFSWWVAVPFTVFACVGIINAVNMIDGVNGLSSSLCIFCNLCFGIIFVKSGNFSNAIINFTFAASLLPFLFHNVVGKKSKMFIGDAGTMVMGILMSWDVIQVLRSDTSVIWMENTNQGIGLVAFTMAILSVPVFDTVRVMVMRILNHKSPFSPDKTHLHHVLLNYSGSHAVTTLCEVSSAIVTVLVWMVSYILGASVTVQFYVVIASSIIFVWFAFFFLSHKRFISTGVAYSIRKWFAKSRQGDKDWWVKLQEFADRGEL